MKEKEEIKLLRCPSCGDMVYTDLLEEKHEDDSISEYHAVICQNCGAMVIGAYDNRYKYCHHNDTDEHRDCLDYLQREDLGCEECPYYYADLDWESD